jgi:hypothetical protein
MNWDFSLHSLQSWSRSKLLLSASLLSLSCLASAQTVKAAPPINVVIPGTGVQLTQVGDDFEDESWGFIPNGPKSSEDIDEQQRQPLGTSTNGRWYEGAKRGYPDVMKRVATPEGGIPGSEGALLLKSLKTGIPGKITNEMHQDDFICNVQYRVGGPIPVSKSPSATTRVYLPPIEEWENRNGPHFAFRAAVKTTIMEPSKFIFAPAHEKDEIYWPGLFILRETKKVDGKIVNNLFFRVRSDRNGGDFRGPDIETTGWWTLGLSFTPDGVVHYFARPGVEDLTREDYIASALPYGYRCETFRTFFYNTVNKDDGKSWSTGFIIDDPKVFVIDSARTASRPSPTKSR